MAKATCSVIIVRVMDTLQGTAHNRSNQRVMEKEMLKEDRKETSKEKAKERADSVIIVGKRAILRTVVGKARDGKRETLKAKAKVNNGVGKAKVLMKWITVTEKLRLWPKLTLEESG